MLSPLETLVQDDGSFPHLTPSQRPQFTQPLKTFGLPGVFLNTGLDRALNQTVGHTNDEIGCLTGCNWSGARRTTESGGFDS
jgi:hypothetical protein